MKSDEFKKFVSKRLELAKYVERKEMTWQDFYELYDLYGENSEVWDKYLNSNKNNKMDILSNTLKNIDTNSIKNHISTAQKAIDFIGDLTKKNTNTLTSLAKGPVSSRPLNKFFED